MLKQGYEIDEIGFIKEIHVIEFDAEGGVINKLPSNYITESPPDGLYRAKWNGTEWHEGATQEEIQEILSLHQRPPSDKERITELENIILTLLMEV